MMFSRTLSWPLGRLTAIALLALAMAVAPRAGWAEGLADSVREALGGAESLSALKAVSTRAAGSNFSRDYNHAPGGPPQHLSNDRLIVLWRLADGAFRAEVELDAWYPFPDRYAYSEAYDGAQGSRSGPKDYRPGGAGALEAPYIGAMWKRLLLSNPQILFARAGAIAEAEPIGAGPRLRLAAADAEWLLEIDPATALPDAVETEERDSLFGAVTVRAEYGDWRRIDGVMTPHRIAIHADGVLSRRERRIDMSYIAAPADETFRVAEATGTADGQAIERGFAGAHMLGDRAAMSRPTDLRPQTPIIVRAVGPGLFQLGGTSHNSLLIEGVESLVLVDAPIGNHRSEDILAMLGERFPGKPLETLILTHHHLDHSGGYAAFVEAGARLVVGAPAFGFFEDATRRRFGRDVAMTAVSGRAALQGFDRPVELIAVPNSHADGMLVVHVKDAGLLFVTDLYSAGRSQQSPLYSAELLSALHYEGFERLTLVGGHGEGAETVDVGAWAKR